MNKQIITILSVYVSLLAGCASGPNQQLENEVATVAVENKKDVLIKGEVPDKGQVVSEGAEKKVAPSSLSPELLHQLLVAEIAGQKGLHDQALDGYLGAAKQTRDPRIAERAAQIALYLKDDVKALEAAKLWRERDPENISAMKVAMMFQVKSGQLEQAYQQLVALQARSTDVDFGNTLLDVVKVLVSHKEDQDALNLMAKVSETYPDKARVHYAQAVLALQKKSRETALLAVSEALKLDSDWEQALILKAQILADNGDQDQAEQLLSSALQNQPQNSNLRMVYTQFLVKSKKLPQAERQFKRIIKDDPDNKDAYFTLAMVQLQQDKPEQAKKSLKALLDQPGWRERAAYYLGRLEADNGQHKQALRWFDSVSRGPMVLDAQLNAALMLVELKQQQSALEKLKAAQKKFPKAGRRIYLIRAEIYSKAEDFQAAYDVLSQGLEEMPEQMELLYSRALIAERLDRLDLLEADLGRVLEKQPDNVNALNALGYTLADKTTRLDESQQYLERAIKLRPDDAVILDSYGWLQFRLNQLQLAEESLRKAHEKFPDPEIAAHFGEVLWVMGNRSEALKVWRAAEEREPNNRHLENIKQRFSISF